MKTQTVDELAFYDFHESLKARGHFIIRCFERNSRKGRLYTFIYL
jgi:hypothetical protein